MLTDTKKSYCQGNRKEGKMAGKFRILILILVTPWLFSCASYFKRKTCEKTNWFAHGEKIALSGKRIDADGFVNECKRVEAEINEMDLDLGFKKGMATYCTAQGAYETGLKGQKFTFDMCADNLWKKLEARHKKGVQDFCVAENGYKQGAKGWEYNNICPKKLERAFLVKYYKGRRVYLRGEIEDRRERRRELDKKVMNLRLEKSGLNTQLTRVEASINFRRHSRSQVPGQVAPETPEETRMKEDLRSQIRNKQYQIDGSKRESEKLQKEITELKRKLRAVPRN